MQDRHPTLAAAEACRASLAASAVSILLAIVALSAPFAARAQGLVPIGVVDFTSSVGTNWTRRLPELIVDELVNSGSFDVLEREKLDTVAREIEFQSGAFVDPAKAVRIGGMSGARLLVTGNIIESRSSRDTVTAYNVRSEIHRYYLKARLELIDLESGSKIFSHVADSLAELKKVGANTIGRGEDSLGPDVAKKLIDAMLQSERVMRLTEGTVPAEPVAITITSSPEGADVEIDGVYHGNAGGSFEVTPGVHDIAVSLPGHEVWSKQVKVSDGMSFTANLAKRVDSRIEIQVDDGGGRDATESTTPPTEERAQ